MTATGRRTGHPPLAGHVLGILVLDTRHEIVPGNVQSARSFSFPVLYEVVRGVSVAALMRGDPRAKDAVVEGARRLEAAGVAAIVGACGSFANYQTAVTSALQVPVFLSTLLLVPLLLRVLPRPQSLGVIFAGVSSFTQHVKDECGITSSDRIVAVGVNTLKSFEPILNQCGTLNSEVLRRGVTSLSRKTLRRHPQIGAWLLQCSDLPPYAWDIQNATNRPVFDAVSLAHHVYSACEPPRWQSVAWRTLGPDK